MFDPMMAGALLALVSSAGILGAFALMCACMAYLQSRGSELRSQQRRAPVEAGDDGETWGNSAGSKRR